MRRFTRAFQIGLATLVAMVGLGVVAAPAYADTNCSNLGPGVVCAWTSANYTGSKWLTNTTQCQNIASPWNDNITSIKVNSTPSTNDWIFYIDPNCTGGFITYSNGTNIAQLASSVDNKYSSVRHA